jgi:hypothetical protein
MAKFRPGIPDSFTLNVEPVRDLGDYLDEPSPTPQRKAKPQAPPEEAARGGETPPAPEAQVGRIETPPAAPPAAPPHVPRTMTVGAIIEADVVPPPERPATSALPQVQAPRPAPRVQTPPVNEDVAPKPKAPRREISMTPETLRMSDELLAVIRSGSGQRDTKANELFHALVLLVHEVMDEIDPHSIPKRGRWGTPTARAYPLELKNAFLKALLEKYGSGGGEYPATGAA